MAEDSLVNFMSYLVSSRPALLFFKIKTILSAEMLCNFKNFNLKPLKHMLTIIFFIVSSCFLVCLFDLMLYIPVNNFSVISGSFQC